MPQDNESRDVTAVALASLVKLVGLLCAELVVGSHRDDIDLIENSVRAKLHASVDGVSPDATAAGVALAHRLVEPVLRDVRERVRLQAESKAQSETQPADAPKLRPAARMH